MTAIFDLDGTITRRDTYIPFLFMCARNLGPRPALVLLPIYFILYMAGIIDNRKLKEVFLRIFLSGARVEDVDRIAERFAENLLKNGMNRSAIKALERHKREKHRVILATASFDLYIGKIARRLGIPETVCTMAEVKDGRVTGRILGENCRGAAKLRMVEKVIGSKGWGESVMYSDHYSDLPLLVKAGKGYLVNPGFKTRLKLKGCALRRLA